MIKHLKTNVFIFIFCLGFGTFAQADVLLKNHQGQTISFNSLKGNWIFINYWASWCKTCVAEIPELNRFYKKHGQRAHVFGVNYDALPLQEQKHLLQSLNIQYPALIQDPAKALGLQDIAGVPVTFVFNPQGELSQTLYGGQSLRDLEQALVRK